MESATVNYVCSLRLLAFSLLCFFSLSLCLSLPFRCRLLLLHLPALQFCSFNGLLFSFIHSFIHCGDRSGQKLFIIICGEQEQRERETLPRFHLGSISADTRPNSREMISTIGCTKSFTVHRHVVYYLLL